MIKNMYKIKYLIVFYLFFVNVLFSYEENINKYKFEIYYLIKGQMKKNKERPNFGWRILKTFPLSVKEYTYPSQFYNYNSEELAEVANTISGNLTEARKKNAIYIANEIYRYINENIENREINKEIKESPTKVYFSYRQVLREKKGCDVEKCRLAITLFRFFTIPARMVYINNHYAVEYFIMPLKGKGDWFLMDFSDNKEQWQLQEYSFPVYWQPLDSGEMLNEIWDKNCYLDMVDVTDIFLKQDEKEAISIYTAITTSVKNFDEIQSDPTPDKDKFMVLKRVSYELWLPNEEKNIKINFILPFNAINFFRTKYWWVKNFDNRIEINVKRLHTEVKPPQEGMIIKLPIEFKVRQDNFN